MESQLQKKEVALLAVNNKIELLTSDLQNKVEQPTPYLYVIVEGHSAVHVVDKPNNCLSTNSQLEKGNISKSLCCLMKGSTDYVEILPSIFFPAAN